MAKALKTIFTCQACGYQTPKWMGKCPDCGQWDALVEEMATARPGKGARAGGSLARLAPVPLGAIDVEDEDRLLTGIGEFDRVLGGGLVSGSLVLIGGDPGIGKSTLMLQSSHLIAANGYSVLYVSGEESIKQLKIRSNRLFKTTSEPLCAGTWR